MRMEKIEDTKNETLNQAPVKNDFDDSSGSEPRVYELGYLLFPSIVEEKVPEQASLIKSIIEKNQSTIISDEIPRHMTLAYTMYQTKDGKKEKFDTAYFGSIKFETEPLQILLIKEELDTNKNILRYIIFKTVRENTRSEVRIPIQPKIEKKIPSTKIRTPLRKEEKKVPISEEELDRTIEKLVVE